MTDPLDFAQWEENPQGGDNPVDTAPPGRPTEWNGKPIPENAVWEDDGVTPKLTPSGRIRRAGRKTQKSTTTVKASNLNSVRDDLVELFAFSAVSSAPLLPTVSLVITERGEMTADAIITIAKDKPKMLASIQRAAKFGPVVVLAQTGVHLFAAITLDVGRAPVDNPLAVMTGVSAKYHQTHPNTPRQAPTGPAPPFTGGSDAVPPFIAKPHPDTLLHPEHARYSFSARPGPGDNGEDVGAPAPAFTPHMGGALGNPFPE
jgi:hypothetical protein